MVLVDEHREQDRQDLVLPLVVLGLDVVDAFARPPAPAAPCRPSCRPSCPLIMLLLIIASGAEPVPAAAVCGGFLAPRGGDGWRLLERFALGDGSLVLGDVVADFKQVDLLDDGRVPVLGVLVDLGDDIQAVRWIQSRSWAAQTLPSSGSLVMSKATGRSRASLGGAETMPFPVSGSNGLKRLVNVVDVLRDRPRCSRPWQAAQRSRRPSRAMRGPTRGTASRRSWAR